MVKTRSFKDYISNRFYDLLFDAISRFIEENYDSLNFRSNIVRQIDSAELMDISIKQVYINDLPGMDISFEILIEVNIEIRETDRRTDRIDEISDWFKISCLGNLERALSNLTIKSVEEYSSRSKHKNTPLSDSLIPIISKEKLDETANKLLEKFYPEALTNEVSIDPLLLATKMGLTVKLQHITPDFSIFGQVFFDACETTVFNKKTNQYEKLKVGKGTILVDPDAYFLRNLGSVNMTIVHECVHWALHRKAYALEHLFNEEATQIDCLVRGGIKEGKSRTATGWMEWQANSLASRILMPYQLAKRKAEEYLLKYRILRRTSSILDIMEPVIEEMAAFFCVSRIAAKVRMIDLGYDEAIGSFTYLDGRYVQPYTFRKDAIPLNLTYSISKRDAVLQCIESKDLAKKVSSGNYIFVDSHFCINNERFIEYDDFGNAYLTEYARHNMDKCCLAFKLVIANQTNDYCLEFFKDCALYRDVNSEIQFEAKFMNIQQNNDVDAQAKTLTAFTKEISDVLQNMPGGFSKALVYLMKWKEMTVEELAEAAYVDPKTIQRLRGSDDYQTKIETIIAVCIGLQLHPYISNELIKRSSCSLGIGEKYITYRFILDTCYTKTIAECNDLLETMGLAPLTKLSE